MIDLALIRKLQSRRNELIRSAILADRESWRRTLDLVDGFNRRIKQLLTGPQP